MMLAFKTAAVAAAFLLSLVTSAAAAPVTYVQDNFIGAPGAASQMVYSVTYGAVITRTTSRVQVMSMTSGMVHSFSPNAQFTDISLSPDGRYVFVADFAVSGGRIGRIDLQSGTYESKPVAAIPYRIEATDTDRFILASQDQWISLWLGRWGTGSSVDILNSSPGGYYASIYYGDIEYDRTRGRLIHGNNGSSSHEIKAFGLVGDNFVGQESSGTYGSADAYGGSSVLATDASRFYYGRLQVLASDVRQNQFVFPGIIVAATGADAFASGGSYYDAATGDSLGSLGYPVGTYGLNPSGDDFWAYDSSTNMLRHFVPAGGPPPAPEARPDFASVAQGYTSSIDVAANDVGLADNVTLAIVTAPGHGTASVTGSPGNKADVRVRYTAESGYVGPDNLEYSIDDGSGARTASVGIDVAAAKAFNDSYVVLNGTSKALYVLANDVGFGPQMTVSVVASPSQGGYAYVYGSPGSRSSVYISYQPPYNATPPYTDTFTYQVTTGSRSDTASVAVHVVSYAAIDDELVVGADTPATLDVVANDLGFGYSRTVEVFTNPLHGSVTFASGTATYIPAPGYVGSDSFEYLVDDGTYVDTARVAVQVIVDADNDKVSDTDDNCLGQANADQRDTDGDGFGNWCDGDFNNDGRINFADLAIFRSRFATADPTTDLDGNGAVNFADLARLKALFGGSPGPSALVP